MKKDSMYDHVDRDMSDESSDYGMESSDSESSDSDSEE